MTFDLIQLAAGQSGATAGLKQDVIEALRKIHDPEIPVNIYGLGLVYSIDVDETAGAVRIEMTLTAPGCQMGMMITQEIQEKLLGIPGCDDACVEIVWDPPWTPHMMSEAAKKQLNIDD